MNKIDPQSWKKEMPEFRRQTEAFYAGNLKPSEYKGLSGLYGSYAQRGGQAMLPYAMQILQKQTGSWDGRQITESRKCVLIPGGLHLRSRRVKHDVIPEEIYTTEF